MRSIPTLLARGLKRYLGPAVPPRLRLAFDYQLAQLDGCEPELALLHQLGPNRGTAIDAGANEGLFTYRLSTLYNRVHAFEINPTLADRLRRLVPSKVSVYPVGLSSREGSGTLYTPYYHGRPLHGWAGLELWNCPTAERHTESVVSVRPLDSFGFDDVSFLKVDVEGHELELLTGGAADNPSRPTGRAHRGEGPEPGGGPGLLSRHAVRRAAARGSDRGVRIDRELCLSTGPDLIAAEC